MNRQAAVRAKYNGADPPSEYAVAFKALADQSHCLQLNARYEASHRNAFYRAFKGFMELRAMMKSVPPPPEPEPLQPEPEETTPVTTIATHPEPQQPAKCETNPRTPAPAAPNNVARPTNGEEPRQPDLHIPSPDDETGCNS